MLSRSVVYQPRQRSCIHRCMVLVLILVVFAYIGGYEPSLVAIESDARGFGIRNNVFVRNGSAIQLISGSIHYHRIHPAYWKDRLLRVRSLGLNTIQLYVPWNFHEQTQGKFSWEGFADVEGFIKLAADLNLMVLVRTGPYICAEWDFGGLPFWLASTKVAGGRTMKLRSSDASFLEHVDAWWSQLLPRLQPLLWQHGGPIIMMQIENEYGLCGHDKNYLRHLVTTARKHLGSEVILYTTDPPFYSIKGSLSGSDVYTVVDFGPSYFWLRAAFAAQRAMNPSGQSPAFNSEYYTGWLTHWGEAMANTSAVTMASTLRKILAWGHGTGSVSLYMAHGGTNFGYWAGSNPGSGPHVTSYDYDAPISEAGSAGQPGIGGPSKFKMIRDTIEAHTGVAPPPEEAPPHIAAMGSVHLTSQALLMENIEALAGSRFTTDDYPRIMEEYGQRGGLIVYQIKIPVESIQSQANAVAVLDFTAAPKDYAQVLINGRLVGSLTSNSKPKLPFLMPAEKTSSLTMDVVVHAMGRSNFGCVWDTKGLQSSNVTLNGVHLVGWEVFPLQLEDLTSVVYPTAAGPTTLTTKSDPAAFTFRLEHGPKFFRGTFQANATQHVNDGHPSDTFLATPGFVKGLAFINGFNLGWYWPLKGPQQRLYIPGPLIKIGVNELVLLEVEAAPINTYGDLMDSPEFRSFRPLRHNTPKLSRH